MWIKREIESYLNARATQSACLVLVGARQTGKSSLLQHLYPKIPQISLDLPRLAQEADSAGESFLTKLGSPAIIDEVQHAPKLFRYLKHFIDSNKKKPGQYFLTGSEKFQLMEGISESLSGRAAIVEIHSLSMRELEAWSGSQAQGKAFWKWIVQGGYPEIYEKKLDSALFFGDYLATYIERDVRRVINIKNFRAFDQFMRLLANRVGQLLSYNNIASDLGVSATTIKEWVHILTVTNVAAIVEPWFTNARKRVVKTPKVFFLDTGLLCFLNGIETIAQLQNSPLKGQIFENHVYCEMTKAAWNQGKRPQIYFFRDHAANEIDFVIPRGGNFDLYECKISEDPPTNLKPFQAFQENFPKATLTNYYVTPGRTLKRKTSGKPLYVIDSLSF